MRAARAIMLAALLLSGAAMAQDNGVPLRCGAGGLQLQALGTGGKELHDGRAAGGWLLWIDGKARALLDPGPGTALRLRQSGAHIADIDVVLFSRVHADRTLDFPALVAAALREGRRRPLPVYGPPGSRLAPSTVTFVRTLFDGTRGAYRHLGVVLSPLAEQGFRLEPHDARPRPERVGVRRQNPEMWEVYQNTRLRVVATTPYREGAPALAWRLHAGERTLVFIGDAARGDRARLGRFAHDTDILAADGLDAPADATGTTMLAAVGRLAAAAGVKHLLLPRSHGAAAPINGAVPEYTGPTAYADDLDCFAVP